MRLGLGGPYCEYHTINLPYHRMPFDAANAFFQLLSVRIQTPLFVFERHFMDAPSTIKPYFVVDAGWSCVGRRCHYIADRELSSYQGGVDESNKEFALGVGAFGCSVLYFSSDRHIQFSFQDGNIVSCSLLPHHILQGLLHLNFLLFRKICSNVHSDGITTDNAFPKLGP